MMQKQQGKGAAERIKCFLCSTEAVRIQKTQRSAVFQGIEHHKSKPRLGEAILEKLGSVGRCIGKFSVKCSAFVVIASPEVQRILRSLIILFSKP